MEIWINKANPKITAQKAYEWIDRVLILDENRVVLRDITYTEFSVSLDDWIKQ